MLIYYDNVINDQSSGDLLTVFLTEVLLSTSFTLTVPCSDCMMHPIHGIELPQISTL